MGTHGNDFVQEKDIFAKLLREEVFDVVTLACEIGRRLHFGIVMKEQRDKERNPLILKLKSLLRS
jgi:hypothetical protein